MSIYSSRDGGFSDQPVGRRDLVLLALAAACWGLGTVVSKRAIDEISPFVLFPIQLVGGLVALALVMRRAGLLLVGSPPLLGRLGILNPGLAYALGLIGLTSISASLYVLLWALEPLLILVLAGLFLGEGITRRFTLLSAIAAVGMGLVVYQPATSGQWPGVALTLAGVGCCAAYTVIARRWVGTADSTAQVVLAQLAYALAFAAVLALTIGVVGGDLRWSGVSQAALVAAVGSGSSLLRRCVLVLPERAAEGAGVTGSDLVLPDSDLRAGGELCDARRAARSRTVGWSRHRDRRHRRDHPTSGARCRITADRESRHDPRDAEPVANLARSACRSVTARGRVG